MQLNHITKRFAEKTVFDDFSLQIEERKTTYILGVSGCGKTTLLNIIAGIVPYEGDIVDKPGSVGYIFQTPSLIDHLTVEQNLHLILKSQIR